LEKCGKIFVKPGLGSVVAQTSNDLAEIAKTKPTTVFQSLGSLKAQIRVVDHILPGRGVPMLRAVAVPGGQVFMSEIIDPTIGPRCR
jgi:hypothetical protein